MQSLLKQTLADKYGSLLIESEEGRTIVKLPLEALDPIDTVVVLRID